MPTIDDLPAAISVSDGDELVISQSDVARKATRAQLLSGVQPAMVVPTASLLGRVSTGMGPPETIALGANLTLSNGTLSAPAPFQISALPSGGPPAAADLIAVSQGGQNAAIPYSALMSGLTELPALDLSRAMATPTGSNQARTLADLFSGAIEVEDFGARGDGITDDTAAFVEAAASGLPLRLKARVYVVNGAVAFSTTPALVGVAGATCLRRMSLSVSEPWITVSGQICAEGVSFEAGSLQGTDGAAVTVTSACTASTWIGCAFSNATGSVGGHGISVQGAPGSLHSFVSCHAINNALHGIYYQGSGTATVDRCTMSGSGGSGIRVEAGVSLLVRSCTSNSNSVGISVGNWFAGPAPVSSTAICVVTGNSCSGNTGWGIAVAGTGAVVSGNILDAGDSIGPSSGLLVRVGQSRVDGNLISGGGVGLDARGCWGSQFLGQSISGAGTAIVTGGAQNLSFKGNFLSSCGWGVVISAIEPGLSTVPTGPLTIEGNWIGYSTAQSGGISLADGAQGVAIIGNDLNGWGSALRSRALCLRTDSAVVRGNRWNSQFRATIQGAQVSGLSALVIPDCADEVLVTNAVSPVNSVITEYQATMLGQIGFIRVQAGGSGYTQAQVGILGTGNGAAATAVVSSGQVVWIVVTNPGSGYGLPGTPVTVTISGDGSGATATAVAGLPPLEGRRLHVSCGAQVNFSLGGSQPALQSWTEYSFAVPAFGSAEFEAVQGGWRATSFPPVDYLTPTGDGGAILQSLGTGHVVLRPGAGGALALSNASEPVGCTSSVGRGSPLGQVNAPPGSDFRNLNGGPGNTYWIKQSATDATGWVAVA